MNKQQPYSRTERVNQQLLEIISRLMISDVRDPRVEGVQITAVDVSRDMRHARVFYVMLDSEPGPQVQEALDRLSGFIRRNVGKQVRMKHTPDLHFTFDESVERGRHMDALFDKIHADDQSAVDEEA